MGELDKQIASFGNYLFEKEKGEYTSGIFVGFPFYMDYSSAKIIVSDSDKNKSKGIPQGCFLLAYYNNPNDNSVKEAILMRVLGPSELPTDDDNVRSMIEYYKDTNKTGNSADIDSHTRYEFSFSGLTCRILGTFYEANTDGNRELKFGADLENYFSANNYKVFKPNSDILDYIVNYKNYSKSSINGVQIGKVRYSSSRRYQQQESDVIVKIDPNDFIGKRTALFGMTRTGKSNTVKKIIQATQEINLKKEYLIGQIIFDINGEYANANPQDEGSAIFEKYEYDTIRYSTIEKEGFEVMKVNFYEDIGLGFEFVKAELENYTANYVTSILSINLEKPSNYSSDFSVKNRYERKVAAYKCCLYKAGFECNSKIRFTGRKDLNQIKSKTIDPKENISYDEAIEWFENCWENYENYNLDKKDDENEEEWADADMKAILIFLTGKKKPKANKSIDGCILLHGLKKMHSLKAERQFEVSIIKKLVEGKIVILDLSQGDPSIQQTFSTKICKKIFDHFIKLFIGNKLENNYIQFYFEEAHNLFPKKESTDLKDVYNRIAKEGAKLHLGLIYATQEVSSISSNILKNTQNWFIAHLNNEDETRELKKYYDFSDFCESLIRFSQDEDKGFVRMKTYSNPYVIPVQIDKFEAK